MSLTSVANQSFPLAFSSCCVDCNRPVPHRRFVLSRSKPMRTSFTTVLSGLVVLFRPGTIAGQNARKKARAKDRSRPRWSYEKLGASTAAAENRVEVFSRRRKICRRRSAGFRCKVFPKGKLPEVVVAFWSGPVRIRFDRLRDSRVALLPNLCQIDLWAQADRRQAQGTRSSQKSCLARPGRDNR